MLIPNSMLKPKPQFSFTSHIQNLKQFHHSNNKTTQKPLIQHLLLSLLKQCVSIKSFGQIHTQMLICSIPIFNYLLPKLIDLKDFNYANLFFSQIPNPNEYSFNVMIRGLATTWGKYDLALEFYYKMKFLGLKTDKYTYPFVLLSCGNLLALDYGLLAHCSVLKTGLNLDCHVCHSLITMYSRCRQLGCARNVFDEIAVRDSVSWNSMISGYSKMGYAKEALILFEEMREEGFEPGEMTLVSVLSACGDLGDLNLGRWVEEFVLKNQMELNSYMGSSLIGMYGKCGDFSSARRIFDSMKIKDIVTWNAMITSCAQNGLSDEAIKLFNSMRMSNIVPNEITLIGVLTACASVGALDFGKWVDSYASQNRLHSNIYVATALIDMYAKCGSLDQACRVFDSMTRKNEVSWNAMISALAFHGRAEEALLLFNRMLKEGGNARPNDITFIGVLSACVHVGYVDEGYRWFNLMSSSFGIVPKIEHYSCMVDLLARAGRVHEAWSFIEGMPEKPDEVMLGALLGACKKIKKIDISEKVMKLILELEPSNSGNYVISSKIYANMKRWDESAKMLVLMRDRGVAKTPGCSWVEIESTFYEFHAGEGHICSREIHQIFDFLNEEMRIEGYIPNTDCS